MAIKMTCPSCGKVLSVPDGYKERVARCPNCHERFRIPAAEAAANSSPEDAYPQAPPPQSQMPPYMPWSQMPRARTSAMAIASLVLGILGLFCGLFAGLPALILGIVALRAISRSKENLTGKGMAIAGTCLGGVSLLVTLIFVLLLLPALGHAREEARKAKCKINLRQIGLGVMMYTNDFDDYVPPSLAELYPEYVSSRMCFICPSSNEDPSALDRQGEFDARACSYRYIYYGSFLGVSNTFETPLAFDKTRDNHVKGVNVLFLDGHVEWQLWDQFMSLLESRSQDENLRGEYRDAIREALDAMRREAP